MSTLHNWAAKRERALEARGPHHLRLSDRHRTYASLSRRAGADLRLLQKAMGHASITVTAHTYADLYDDELDNIAIALDALPDLPQQAPIEFGPILALSTDAADRAENDFDLRI